MEYTSLFETKFGTGIVFSSAKGICRVLLPAVDADCRYEQAAAGISSPLTELTSDMLNKYFKGVPQNFATLSVDLDELTLFRSEILQHIRSIPFGKVMSYGEVAAMVGLSGAARAIGGAMASNPVPIIIPCHRIVGANGKLTGFSAPGGIKLKKYLLQMEGVEFQGEGVRQKNDGYKQGKVGMKI